MNEAKVRQIVEAHCTSVLPYGSKDALIRALVEQGCDECRDLVWIPRALPDDPPLTYKDHSLSLLTRLNAWHSVFGTTQLTHARARLESAESERDRLSARIKKLEAQLARPKECNDIECYYDYPHNAH